MADPYIQEMIEAMEREGLARGAAINLAYAFYRGMSRPTDAAAEAADKLRHLAAEHYPAVNGRYPQEHDEIVVLAEDLENSAPSVCSPSPDADKS